MNVNKVVQQSTIFPLHVCNFIVVVLVNVSLDVFREV